MSVQSIVQNSLAQGRAGGAVGIAQWAIEDLRGRWYERRLGIQTQSAPTTASLSNPEWVEYTPLPYGALMDGLRAVPLTSDTHLLDYGCGMGRILIAAAAAGAGKVTGVEIQSGLSSIAEHNKTKARGVRSEQVEILNTDATAYRVPDTVTVITLFKPFGGETLASVVTRISESMQRAPRDLYLIFFNDQEFRTLAADTGWLRRHEARTAMARTQWPIEWGLYRAIKNVD